MIEFANEAERLALIEALREGYMEIFPTATIEERLSALGPNAYVAVTCSPSKGVGVTLDTTEHLVAQGYRVVPHIAAKMVRDRGHLTDIMRRLDDLPVDSIFVPGGDARQPLGEYHTAFELLQDIAEFDHRFTEIGIAAHPEGHPDASDKRLLVELEKKQPLATYIVTQMCFDTGLLASWLHTIRERGIHLPVWLGIPGEAERAALIKTSLRIGVGDSLRFLKRKSGAAAQLMATPVYTPNELMSGLAPLLVDPVNKIDGLHIFCFNLVDRTERWRRQAVADLEAAAPP